MNTYKVKLYRHTPEQPEEEKVVYTNFCPAKVNGHGVIPSGHKLPRKETAKDESLTFDI